ncbi:hypothetical protein HHI36_022957 [Cryptolaemus montrouzieri]|uniref:DUF4773 domain-containing protein n=1 Tax=Cryptolaemus montrouzieri TaxID=559131 RepID=A0ABD2PFN2_9CUCU
MSPGGLPKFGDYGDRDEGKNQSRKPTVGDLEEDEMNIFYDPASYSSFRVTYIENSLINPLELSDQSFTKSGKILRRIGYRANGCSCQELTCGCCLGINMNQFNFNREGCINFSYRPEEFVIDMNMILNNESVYQNSISGRNPPPICLPISLFTSFVFPVPVDICAKVFDIYTKDQNIHMCFDLEARISQAQVLILHFDCMVMGRQGVAPLKPGEAITTTTTSTSEPDIFDPVTEIKYKNKN